MNPVRHSTRQLFALGALACAGLLAFGYYLQYVRGLEPCPLCLVQRGFFYLVLATCALVAVAGYQMDGSWVMLSFATVVLLVGGRIFAGILGGWIGDDIGYNFAHKKLLLEWHDYAGRRDGALPPADQATPSSATATGSR